MNSETVETKKNVIVLDPGHGGSDPGMIGVDGLEEKGINLSVSLLLKEKLEEKGYTVMLTRESDQGLYDDSAQNKKAQDMQRRIALIDETAPVLTVSIHQNSYHDPMVKGPQVFYYETSSEGKELAADLQESLNTVLEVERPREIKGNTSYYLLKRSKGLLVIAECGFLTNPEEAALLQTEEYQGKVASALAEGILAYLQKQ
nr:N-acetylmuramoyl-L-alanine amidase [uncultured Blautia sp.]